MEFILASVLMATVIVLMVFSLCAFCDKHKTIGAKLLILIPAIIIAIVFGQICFDMVAY